MPGLAWRFVFVVLFNLCAVSWSMAADWQVVRVVGAVWVVKIGMEPMRATAGMVLPDNATVETMHHGRAMLRHGEDLLNIGPDTQLAPQARLVHGLTTVLMREGKVDLDIEPRGAPHFVVETPLLAAVVKGTRFSVTSFAGNAAVSVARGRVAVTALGAGQAVEVTNGQTARVADGALQLSGSGALSPVQSVAPRAAMVESANAEDNGSSGSSESGNANASANGKAKGQAENAASATSNAGGNSAAHASSNSNAGGNSANSNAGGNGKSNAGGNGNGNSNAGGNGNGKGEKNRLVVY